ncbi:hypothetical protein QTG54_011317 [Skeletonema marinoi]|uniref:Uncharacterized protein n=1 Tax=Skeletonema marinoi TaxID=267567 RepID=A0AAD8Y1X8_9STRA|nr:hypothetical protein QTG54_011317 [Skeletonema marinoi]
MKSRQNHLFAATLLLLSIFSENSVEIVAVDSPEAVDHAEERNNDAASAAEGKETINNVVGSKDQVTNNNNDADVEGNSIDDEKEYNSHHDIPSSIAEATLVGARLRQQLQENDNKDSSHSRNNIDINLLEWSELPTPMKEAALTLGCNSQIWDDGEESSQCELFWSELTQEEQKAAMVLGYQSSSWDGDDEDGEDEQELSAPEAADENDAYPNPQKAAHITGCHHWGAMGCNKGNANAGLASTTASKINATPGVIDDNDDDDSMILHQSSLAGSATAKIEAHVMKGVGKSSPLSAKKDMLKANNKVGMDSTATSNNPPQGFTLSARIVTSPHDGLSYFLDVPDVDMTTMMTVPYTFLDCGRNIESTTEAFSLDDLVVRHLPAGADISHWVNLGGGVTIDTEDDEDEDSSPRYINGNHDGRPRLLVALTPIEIIVSGNDEESRTFAPGEMILMEDTLGKGHKMKANARGKDLSVIMISLPHTVHYPAVNWSSVQKDHTKSSSSDSESSWHSGAHQSLFGFAPKHRHPRSKARHATKPCPLEYDSVYSSLFTPTSHTNLKRQKRRRRDLTRVKRKGFATTAEDSSDDSNYPPPPGFTTYNEPQTIFKYVPWSLRQSMLVGIGLSLTSSFVYCAQLLYPPFLALWGGATVVVLGAVVNVMGVRWLYQQNWVVVWEEERRWKRELRRHKKRKEEDAAKSKGPAADGGD